MAANCSVGPPPRGWLAGSGRVLQHEQRPGGIAKLVLAAPELSRRARAGQFLSLRVRPVAEAGFDPFLRRPFSLCEIAADRGAVSIVFGRVGRGTTLLSQVAVGAELDLIGPLGRPFPDAAAGSGTLVLLGGGLGIPPLAAAAAAARAVGRPVRAILGARSAPLLAGHAEVAGTGVPITIVTDDGSLGTKELVSAPLARRIAAGEVGEVWACGPEGMLQAVQRICLAAGIPAFVCLERYMGCGTGLCVGCAVKRRDSFGYARACIDGPVFAAEEVDLDA